MSGGRGARLRKPVINSDFVMTPITRKATPACAERAERTEHTLTLELDETIADDSFDMCVLDSFSAIDHRMLAEAVGALGARHRHNASKSTQGRIGKQCRKGWKCTSLPHDAPLPSLDMRAAFLDYEGASHTKGTWREHEDILLCNVVDELGSNKWTSIGEYMPGRTGKQCRERWHNHLNPNLSKNEWTNEEDLLIHMVRTVPSNYAFRTISIHFCTFNTHRHNLGKIQARIERSVSNLATCEGQKDNSNPSHI